MATRLKTIHYGFPQLNTLVNNTLTALTTITAYIPEFSGTVTIRKAIVEVSIQEGVGQTTGNYTSRRIDVSVGGAGATQFNNANLYTGSGENTCVFYAADATTHFTTNWTTGTSKTIAVSVLINGTATTLAWVNVGATLYITYEYDDTQTTQIKTIFLPLDAPVGTLATTKPGTQNATIPALDTELPETTKTYRNMHIISQGNINQTASTTDSSISMQIDALTAYTSQTTEQGATSDYWVRHVWTTQYHDSGGTSQGLGMTTNATHGFYIWGSVARFNHAQCYMVITYEFDASGSSGCFNSIILPAEVGMMGGTASTDFNRVSRHLCIEEPGTITTKQIAYYAFWEQAAAISTLNFRIGTGSFVAYTDGAAVLCGSNGAMVRNDSAFTLVRGDNVLNFDAYRSDTADFGWSLSGFFIVNYTSSKPSQGYGAANHTVFWNSGFAFDGATATNRKTSAFAVSIPETTYFLNSFGVIFKHMTDTIGTYTGGVLLFEKTNASGEWAECFEMVGHTDAETGLHIHCAGIISQLLQYPGSLTGLLDPEGTRRWWWSYGAAVTGHTYLDLIFTYHTITFTVSGNVTGSSGGTVTLDLLDDSSGTKLLTTSRVGDGSYSFTWYDNVNNVYVSARESATSLGRSERSVAT